MATIDLNLLKKLRQETAVSISECRRVLEESQGDYAKALELLKKIAEKTAAKKADRVTGEGIIGHYNHQNGKLGAMVELLCETDFVARTTDFKELVHAVAMQVAAMNPETLDTLLKQEYIKDTSMTIEELVKKTIGKVGENIVIKRFARFAIE